MTAQFFGRNELEALLGELGGDLAAKGIRGEVFIVGGAAMALAYSTRRTTVDIDAVFEPKTEIYAAARRLAARHGLPDTWLNDAVKGMLPGPDPDIREVMSVPGLRVSVPSPRYLLALKVFASRVDRDRDDIVFLAGLCNASTADEVLAITESVMGGRRSQFFIQELFPQRREPWLRQLLKPGRRRTAAESKLGHIKAGGRAPTTVHGGICGARTSRGGYCQNQAGSCPHHR
ncbi:MAG: DUF6036 family nucleotidyltransferase [Mycobacterium sp.]